MTRGRPATTRARCINYLRHHYPCTQGQFIRALGIERSYGKRTLRFFLETEFYPVHRNESVM